VRSERRSVPGRARAVTRTLVATAASAAARFECPSKPCCVHVIVASLIVGLLSSSPRAVTAASIRRIVVVVDRLS